MPPSKGSRRPPPRRRRGGLGPWLLFAAGLVVVGAIAAIAFSGSGGSGPPELRTGPQIYQSQCATCHGRSGQGGIGPSLVGVAQRFPNIGDQIAVVTNGRAAMPAFSARLTSRQIRTVVEYERSHFVR